MIGFLEGTIKEINLTTITLLVHSIGYEIHPPSNLLGRFRLGDSCSLHIHTNVREDDISLYGFEHSAERNVFRKLISISGLGPKMALAILSRFTLEELVACVRAQDLEKFKSIPGVGAKRGEKLLLELKSKLNVDELKFLGPQLGPGAKKAPSIETDIYKALYQLGYKNSEIQYALNIAYEKWGAGFSELQISQALPKILQWVSRGSENELPHE